MTSRTSLRYPDRVRPQIGVLVYTLLILVTGCGAARLALKRPVADQCSAKGLQGCDDLTEAAMAYANGDRAAAESKVRAAAAANSPAQLKEFASALRPVADNLGGDTGEALRAFIAALADARSDARPSGVPPTTAKGASSGVARAGQAATPPEHERLRTYTVPGGLDERAADCGPGPLATGAQVCKRTRVGIGPMIVTNIYASGGCPDELFVASGQRPQWFVMAPASGPMNVSGKLVVDEGEELFVGVRSGRDGPKADVRCAVTWSGYTTTDASRTGGNGAYGTF